MTKTKKILLLISTHTLIALLALYGGATIMENIIKQANAIIEPVSFVTKYANYVAIQRVEAKPTDYKNALLNYLNALEKIRTFDSPIMDHKVYLYDKMFTFTRLSLIENEIGNPEKAANYMKQAINTCNQIDWDNCSSKKLIDITKRLDENSILWKRPKTNEDNFKRP